jgi:Tuftelin interacting protein N terminal/G-patch domain
MSSSDEGGGADSDNEQRVAFTADNDYEDGRWIGGEFFARSEKRGRHQTREERLYGVFADGEDDEDAKFRQRKQDRKGGGGRKREVDLTKALNFVGSSSSSAAQSSSTAGDAKQQQEGDDMELSDEAADDAEQDDSSITEKANAAFRALLQKAEAAPAAKRPRTEHIATATVAVQQSAAVPAAVVVAAPAAAAAAAAAPAAVAAPARAAVKASATKTNADFRAFLMRGLQAASDSNAQAADSTAAAAAAAAAPAVEDSSIARSFDPDTEHPGLGSAADPNAAACTAQQQQQQPLLQPLPPPRPANLDAKFGDWEKHTRGIGMKLMKKMGFTGRLGKHETGVTRQLEVKLRPNGIGLGFGNFKEAATLKVNREIEADRQGKTVEELEIALGIEPSKSVSGKGSKKPGAAEVRRAEAEAAASAGLWRKVRTLSICL